MRVIGEVWAQMLWIVSQRLLVIAKHGFVDDLFPPETGAIPEGDFHRPREHDAQRNAEPLVPKHGSFLTVQLVLDGLKV